ncbi:hypothetical protein CSUB01_03280 [Colletotrichum sublineola]|uniref:Uncharacterized protein n=1 Tax=Colletotrichum sublineola TaxID=1173701 RepID=A0A066XE90_COLSU|nr:hypothetical protein CSUB01_03280 [Colletotrichum sublineola]
MSLYNSLTPISSLLITSSPLLRPLSAVGHSVPRRHHDGKQTNGDRMQHPRAGRLGENTRHKWRHGAAGASKRADNAHPAGPLLPRHPPHEHRRRARVDGPQQQADNGNGHGGPDDVGDPPHEQLEHGGADRREADEELLAHAVCRVRQAQPADSNARPETRCDVAHRVRVAAAHGDEEGDDPARDGHFGALVREDEERAQQHDADLEGGEHAEELRARVDGSGGLLGGQGPGDEVGVVIPERPGGEGAVEDGQRQGDNVVHAPAGAGGGDESRDDEGPDGAADAVGAMEEAEGRGGLAQGATEDVVDGEGEGHAEADHEEGDDDKREGRVGENGCVGEGDDGLSQGEEASAAEAHTEGLKEGSAKNKAKGVANEDKGYNGIADVIVPGSGISLSLTFSLSFLRVAAARVRQR